MRPKFNAEKFGVWIPLIVALLVLGITFFWHQHHVYIKVREAVAMAPKTTPPPLSPVVVTAPSPAA